ncbi:CYTH and CHAD domain-containing protein [Zoogloea sp.]|uniref:CYTH and CHAD domain-containing protein n=1 Tax=Zoogloea sp. TaxID=49181 RepID=UPI002623CA79|nr:CYTH and CHAD domain-containing protein [Zoogloea sp.]MDD3354918.1 CHAD domain-containing protein [Zoogloea sp.]
MSHEIELKLTLPPKALAALRRHPLIAEAPREGRACTLENTYFDTPELELRERRMAVRTRKAGNRWLQTVKCAAESAGGLSSRPEWEQPYANGAFDFSGIDREDVRQRLEALQPRLVPVFSTHFKRETVVLAPREGVKVLAMIDHGNIEANGQSRPLCELELELVEGAPTELYALALQLAENLPLTPENVSKAERGYHLFSNHALRPAKARPSRLQPEMSPVDAFRIIGFDCLSLWQANEAGARESDNPEFIHQLRVALRRLRSALRLFCPALPPAFVARWSDGLKEAADGLGAARDLDVMLDEILSPVAESGLADEGTLRLISMAVDRRDREKAATREQLLAASHGRQMLALAADLYGLQSDALVKSANLTTFARLQLTQLRKKARKRFAAAAELHPEQLHELRVSLKRLRYGIEFLLPLLPEKATVRYANELADIQETLGYINDEVVARSRLKAWAGKDPELRGGAAFVAGWHAPKIARLRKSVLPALEPILWGKAPWTR